MKDTSEKLAQTFRGVKRAIGARMSLVSCMSPAGTRRVMSLTTAMPMGGEQPAIVLTIRAKEPVCQTVTETGNFCLNILAREHAPLIADASFRGADELPESGDWVVDHAGIPYLSTALASIFCRVVASHSYEGHAIILGEADHIRCNPEDERMPLIWLHGMPLD